MWPFKKKVVETPKTPQYRIVREDTEFEVGITEVILTFKDGRIFTQNIYGKVNQYISSFLDYCGPPEIISSLKCAKYYLSGGIPVGNCQHCNDSQNPTRTVVGEFINAELGESRPAKITFNVAKIVPIKDNK